MKCECGWRVWYIPFGNNPLSSEIRLTTISNQHTNDHTPYSDQLFSVRTRSGDYTKGKNAMFEELG